MLMMIFTTVPIYQGRDGPYSYLRLERPKLPPSKEMSKPIYISSFLTPGTNTVDIKLINKRPPVEESGPIYSCRAFTKT